ncbi:MAG: sodium:proton antiporter, partial [Alphaproteobacteria bacterium]
MRKTRPILVFALAVAFAAPAAAAEGPGAAPRLDGAELDLLWGVPFLGILLSIAVFPLLAPHFWHRHFGKISAFWALAFAVPSLLVYGIEVSLFEILHTLLLDYIPFMILLLSLFTVAGGVRLKGSLRGTPLVNTALLFVGTVLASWMGTTGAAMLLIRPVIRANSWRKNNVHVIIFFIFLVANIGGSLTPLGDPPLFLGFLQGVDFFWPTTRMFLPMCLVAGILLALFYVLDSYLFRREGKPPEEDGGEKLGIEGGINLLLVAGVVGTVLMSGMWKPGIGFEIHHVHMALQNIIRDVLLVVLALVSWRVTSLESRRANAFTWFPMIEVGKLFGGIFLTIIPVLAILRAGADGALGELVSTVSADGQPVNAAYFWLT